MEKPGRGKKEKGTDQRPFLKTHKSKLMPGPNGLLLHIALFFGLLLAPVLGWTDFQAGIDAYYHGDYLIAQKEIRPLAEQGHSGAQLLLGLMYWSGRGVADDYVLAHMWLSLAASQGEETAWVYLVKLAKSMTPYQYNTPQILDHRIR